MSIVEELAYFLGLQVKQMEDIIFISRSKYVKIIMKEFEVEKASHNRTSVATHVKLTKDYNGVDVDQNLYRGMIGRLLYVTVSRPDITFDVGVHVNDRMLMIEWEC